ncbi:hypothetical protein [Pectobacterium versatile]|uniref:hypothetical protein n=1 Tax=Pectobacterium versatile TaxID=2488639 RepID=UPI001CD14DC9|nr:hypothetical protein [Pectobacterium versatile]
MKPITLSKMGSFIAGGEKVSRTENRPNVVLRNHAYVEYFIPDKTSPDRPPIILTHNYFTAAGWLGNVEGNEGWAQFFLRNGFPVFVVDPPGTGRAGFNHDDINLDENLIDGALPVDNGFWPGQDSRAWKAWNMGPEWKIQGDGVKQGNQMPSDEAVQKRFLATLIPNKPVSPDVLDETFIELMETVNHMAGPAIFVGWSMAGGLGQRLVLRCPRLFRALILIDGYSGENRFPKLGQWFDNGPISARDQVAGTLAHYKIPLLSMNSATGHISNSGHSSELKKPLSIKSHR